MLRAAPAMQAVMRLDPGTSREHQEDHAGVFPELDLAIVADGMGGHSSGDRAAILTVTVVAQSVHPWGAVPWPPDRSPAEHPLVMAIHLANLSIVEDSTVHQGRKGQGSTVVAVQRAGDGVVIAHVGDSRVHRFRGGVLEQMTEDHSLLNEYIRLKGLTPEEIEAFPHKRVITRALGMMATVEVDVRFERLAPGDLFLLCSDGLELALDRDMITAIMARGESVEATADRMLAEALRRGAPDNLSIALACWPGVG